MSPLPGKTNTAAFYNNMPHNGLINAYKLISSSQRMPGTSLNQFRIPAFARMIKKYVVRTFRCSLPGESKDRITIMDSNTGSACVAVHSRSLAFAWNNEK